MYIQLYVKKFTCRTCVYRYINIYKIQTVCHGWIHIESDFYVSIRIHN